MISVMFTEGEYTVVCGAFAMISGKIFADLQHIRRAQDLRRSDPETGFPGSGPQLRIA